jgi:hypothetical protein
MPRKVCACGCGQSFTGRARQRYLNMAHYGQSAECKAHGAKGGRLSNKRRIRRAA